IADVDASGLWPGKVVTEMTPVGDFWEAEPGPQDYLEHYPNGYTCPFVPPNWKLPRRARVAQRPVWNVPHPPKAPLWEGEGKGLPALQPAGRSAISLRFQRSPCHEREDPPELS